MYLFVWIFCWMLIQLIGPGSGIDFVYFNLIRMLVKLDQDFIFSFLVPFCWLFHDWWFKTSIYIIHASIWLAIKLVLWYVWSNQYINTETTFLNTCEEIIELLSQRRKLICHILLWPVILIALHCELARFIEKEVFDHIQQDFSMWILEKEVFHC